MWSCYGYLLYEDLTCYKTNSFLSHFSVEKTKLKKVLTSTYILPQERAIHTQWMRFHHTMGDFMGSIHIFCLFWQPTEYVLYMYFPKIILFAWVKCLLLHIGSLCYCEHLQVGYVFSGIVFKETVFHGNKKRAHSEVNCGCPSILQLSCRSFQLTSACTTKGK